MLKYTHRLHNRQNIVVIIIYILFLHNAHAHTHVDDIVCYENFVNKLSALLQCSTAFDDNATLCRIPTIYYKL